MKVFCEFLRSGGGHRHPRSAAPSQSGHHHPRRQLSPAREAPRRVDQACHPRPGSAGMTPASRRPRFEPLRSATPPSGAQNAHHSIELVVQFSMSPPVQFRMSFDTQCPPAACMTGSPGCPLAICRRVLRPRGGVPPPSIDFLALGSSPCPTNSDRPKFLWHHRYGWFVGWSLCARLRPPSHRGSSPRRPRQHPHHCS